MQISNSIGANFGANQQAVNHKERLTAGIKQLSTKVAAIMLRGHVTY